MIEQDGRMRVHDFLLEYGKKGEPVRTVLGVNENLVKVFVVAQMRITPQSVCARGPEVLEMIHVLLGVVNSREKNERDDMVRLCVLPSREQLW